jgi:hypothetical protein
VAPFRLSGEISLSPVVTNSSRRSGFALDFALNNCVLNKRSPAPGDEDFGPAYAYLNACAEPASRFEGTNLNDRRNRHKRHAVESLHLDYLSCLLSILSTVLVGRKLWFGFIVAIVNSLIICAIGFHTLQFGFIPANLLCIGISAFYMRSWLKDRPASPDSRRSKLLIAKASYGPGPVRLVTAMPSCLRRA